jgi:CheY-like chemotaxis protein
VLQGQGQKILLVEDEPSVLQITKSMLESLNYLVIPATNGQEALRAYQEHNAEIALVISDMVMPDMGGEILFRTLKASNPDLKMILLSGYPLKGKGVKLIEQDMVAWIQKPISLQQLSQVVSRAI